MMRKLLGMISDLPYGSASPIRVFSNPSDYLPWLLKVTIVNILMNEIDNHMCCQNDLQLTNDNPTTIAPNGSAALFAALFQALARCSPDHRAVIVHALEVRLGSVHDDLSGKLDLLLSTSAMSEKDIIQGLWLLFLSFVVYPEGTVQMWIGPDLFSEDARECLRLKLPDLSPSVLSNLREGLRILAQTVNPAIEIDFSLSDSGHYCVALL